MINALSNNIRHKSNPCGTYKPQDISFFSAQLKTLNQDVVSFKGEAVDQQKYLNKDDIPKIVKKFSERLIDLAINKKNLNFESVESLVREYEKEYGLVIWIGHLPKDLKGDAAICRQIFSKETGDLKAVALFLNFDPPNSLISDITHEFTHTLQAYTLENSNLIHNINADKSGFDSFSKAWKDFETEFCKLGSYSAILNNAAIIDKILNKIQNKLEQPLEVFIKPKRKAQYDQLINSVLSKNGITNKKLALEFFKLCVDNEFQAYKEEIKAIAQTKQNVLSKLNIPSDNEQNKLTFRDLVPKRYEDLSTYLDELITQEEKKGASDA